MKQMAPDNIVASMRETGGKVSGPTGAAALPGVRHTTFHSRLTAFGIKDHEWQ